MDLRGKKPQIDYPCPWAYRVIGRDREVLEAVVAGVVGERVHHVEFSNRSSKGNYVSVRLELTVEDEADRVALFEALRSHSDVIMVL